VGFNVFELVSGLQHVQQTTSMTQFPLLGVRSSKLHFLYSAGAYAIKNEIVTAKFSQFEFASHDGI
jgi:hypothetical protein